MKWFWWHRYNNIIHHQKHSRDIAKVSSLDSPISSFCARKPDEISVNGNFIQTYPNVCWVENCKPRFFILQRRMRSKIKRKMSKDTRLTKKERKIKNFPLPNNAISFSFFMRFICCFNRSYTAIQIQQRGFFSFW